MDFSRFTQQTPSSILDNFNYDAINASIMNFDPPKYEDTIFKTMADDIKAPFEQQINAIQKIADNAKIQADSSVSLANSAETQAKLALDKSKKADIKGWIAILLSALALFIEFAVNYNDILNFITKLFN